MTRPAKNPHLLAALVLLTASATRASAGGGVFESGFETLEGFATGFVGGQQGWTGMGGIIPRTEPRISSAGPAEGLQHLRLARQNNLPNAELKAAFSPDLGTNTPFHTMIHVDVRISTTGGANYHVQVQSPAQGTVAAHVQFYPGDLNADGHFGDILVQDGPGGVGAAFVNTGAFYTPGVYRRLTIEMDPALNRIRYYYHGALIYTGIVWYGSVADQIVLFSDNFQNGGEFADFDNVMIDSSNPCAEYLHGDANGDGLINNFDIDYFIAALLNDPVGYHALGGDELYFESRHCWGDINRVDGQNNFDIDPFVNCIVNTPPAGEECP